MLAVSMEDHAFREEEDLHSSDDEFATVSVTDELQRLSLHRNAGFFGKSSGALLVQTAIGMKKEFNNPAKANPLNQAEGSTRQNSIYAPTIGSETWHSEPASICLLRPSSVCH